MKKVLLVLTALLSFTVISAYAEETLPEIAPVDEVAIPALDTPAADEAPAAPAPEEAPADSK